MSQVASLFELMAERFHPPAAQGLNIVYQFEIVDGGNYFVAINDGVCRIEAGEHEMPSITLILESETMASVVEGSLSSAQAFMFGKVRVTGDLSLGTRLASLFSG
jgi:putative sterol carrier protein